MSVLTDNEGPYCRCDHAVEMHDIKHWTGSRGMCMVSHCDCKDYVCKTLNGPTGGESVQ